MPAVSKVVSDTYFKLKPTQNKTQIRKHNLIRNDHK